MIITDWKSRCPTGAFSFTPLHAAGVFPGGPHFSDYFVSSYTPTLHALLKAQQDHQYPLSVGSVKILLASVEHTTYACANDLPGTLQEISTIKKFLDGKTTFSQEKTTNVIVLHGAQSQALKEQLPDTGILHIASHGVQDPNDPLQSGFLMADGKLTIMELMKLDLPKAFLAILSACHTARGDDKQPDQTVHLAATMLFLGFKSVVATLWYVLDIVILFKSC